MTNRFLLPQRHLGQALVDYVLITALLVIVNIPLWLTLGSDVNQRLSFFNNAPNSSASVTPNQSGSASVDPNTLNNQDTLTVILSNGRSISLANPLGKAAQIIETAGASGATAVLGQTVLQLVQQLAAANEISPSQLSLLLDLANQIHEVAQLQGVLESAYKTVPPTMTLGEFKNQTVVVNGKTYTIADIGGNLEVAGDDLLRDNGFKQFSDLSSLEQLASIYAKNSQYDYYKDSSARKMLNLYMQVKQAGALDNPSINKIVRALTTSVFNLSDSFMDSGFNSITYYGYDPNTPMGLAKQNYMAPPNEMVKTLQTSVKNHTSGVGVCESGNGSDSGQNCTP